MSVISNPEATPNRMRAVYQWLAKSPNYEEEEERLNQLIIPSYHNDTENEKGSDRRSIFVGKVLNEMATAGIVDRVENKVQLSPETLQVMRDKSDDFPVVFSTLLFSNARNDDFLHALAFTFCLDPLHAPSSWHSMEDLVKQANCHDVTGLSADLRYGNFLHWSVFLGMSWEYLTFVPDPHIHIGALLKYEFEKGEMLLTNFLSQLAAKFPVIDGGISTRQFGQG